MVVPWGVESLEPEVSLELGQVDRARDRVSAWRLLSLSLEAYVQFRLC